ncbi:hypothetical protein ILUMI_24332 [Ignelater luminosus]|uniref:Peptidase S1 domain-containing protein n=1 Tax=Ignelater luminosus TaxID=2038154 RepID=A0A8K0CAN8_IGNLU|nr:hypothetical protein ILUMI_24332 [Ignelater luminosus]
MAKTLFILTTIILGAFGLPTADQSLKIDPLLSWRVVGGSDAQSGEFPYQISIRTRSNSHNCGGSIIDTTTILTAAHCIVGTYPSDITVVCGSHKLSTGGVRYEVSKIIPHEDYDNFFKINDIALLKLKNPIEYTNEIQPVNLETEDVGEGEDVLLTGWGSTSYPGSAPDNLQKLLLNTITVEDCRARHGWPIVVSTQICTLTKQGEGACHGDSGGPLVSTKRNTQVGIVNWGQPCARGYPDVFARVSSYTEWINANK